jgi:hypothetical protein
MYSMVNNNQMIHQKKFIHVHAVVYSVHLNIVRIFYLYLINNFRWKNYRCPYKIRSSSKINILKISKSIFTIY